MAYLTPQYLANSSSNLKALFPNTNLSPAERPMPHPRLLSKSSLANEIFAPKPYRTLLHILIIFGYKTSGYIYKDLYGFNGLVYVGDEIWEKLG